MLETAVETNAAETAHGYRRDRSTYTAPLAASKALANGRHRLRRSFGAVLCFIIVTNGHPAYVLFARMSLSSAFASAKSTYICLNLAFSASSSLSRRMSEGFVFRGK